MINPWIKGLNLHDLNQRWRGTYIEYDKKILFCDGFESENVIVLNGVALPFDYTKVEATRLPTGWYITNKAPYYMYYTDSRQFSRGYTQRGNTILYCLNDMVQNNTLERILIQAQERRIKPLSKSLMAVKKEESTVVNQHVLLHYITKEWYKIYYRTHSIGITDLKNIYPRFNIFVDELREWFPSISVGNNPNEYLTCTQELMGNIPSPKKKSKSIDSRIQAAIDNMTHELWAARQPELEPMIIEEMR